MKALLIGAGSVGQVYGRHLARGGAEVTFFVKEKYAAAARRGFSIYPLNSKRGRKQPVRFADFSVMTSLDEVAATTWDYVLLCVSSTAMRSGFWIEELAGAVGDAVLVSFQPGLEDHAFLCERFPAERIINSAIALSSYSAPLPGEDLPEPGTAYWIPPLARLPFSGPRAATRALVKTLRRGGMPARVHKDARTTTAFGGAVLNTQMVALECAGWSFDRLFADTELAELGYGAAREALRISAAQLDKRPPLALRMLRRWQLRMVARLAVRFAPMDMETFFRVHYTKVGDQSRYLFDNYVALGERFGIDTPAIEALRDRLATPVEVVRAAS
jgi:2-dehydropantoate 2-reductase